MNFILHSHELQTFETSIKMATQERMFGLNNCKYTIEEKKGLLAKVKECQQQYDDEVEAMKGKTHWDVKRKRHVPDTPKQGYLAKAVRSFYFNLKEVKNDDKALNAAIKMAKRCYDKVEEGQLDNIAENPKKNGSVLQEVVSKRKYPSFALLCSNGL